MAAALSPPLPEASERDPRSRLGLLGGSQPLPSVTALGSHWNWEVLCAGQVAPLFQLFGYGEGREKVRSQSLRKKSFVAWITRGGFMQGNPPLNFDSATNVSHCLGSVT